VKARNTLGKLTVRIQTSGNQENCEVTEELAIRPGIPLTSQVESGSISAGKPVTLSPGSNWLGGTAKYELLLAPFPAMKFAGGLQYLLEYPYGCVEQTTSRVFPLLYFDNLARATNHPVFKGGNADYFITQGIEKLESMQLREGSFAYWPGGTDSSEWGSIYATNFLIEARKAGYPVTDRVYNKALNYMRSVAKGSDRSSYGLQNRVYALYVLSLAGQPDLSSMAYLKNVALSELSNYSRAQLAAAYYYAGDRKTGRRLLPESFSAGPGKRETGGNFNSDLRSDAIILSVLADVNPNDSAVYKLVSRLSKAAKTSGYWGTTQENAFALMALGKVIAKKRRFLSG
jgi:uncharacterized protein YfaS (alpha-2-macroglobulin family)